MNLTQSDITTAAYLFLVMGGIIALVGSLIVYSHKKSEHRRQK